MHPILTREIAQKILLSKENSIKVSLDLGMTESEVVIEGDEVFIESEKVTKEQLERLKDETCYIVHEGSIQAISMFSEETNRFYKLIPTQDWPTVTISATPMHPHTHTSPKKNAQAFINQLTPVGKVLDTCCGLGYTVILSAKKAEHVYTFEKDVNIQHVASYNPYSQELYQRDNITLTLKPVEEGIVEFEDEFFHRMMHDPPTFKIAPALYELTFHQQLFRVLKKGGVLFHYCPNLGKLKGNIFYAKLVKQLKDVGFTNVVYEEGLNGIRAVKEV